MQSFGNEIQTECFLTSHRHLTRRQCLFLHRSTFSKQKNVFDADFRNKNKLKKFIQAL